MGGERNDVVVMAAGRFNPPTRGHEVLVEELRRVARQLNARPIVFIVDGEKSGQDGMRNPLSANQRLALLGRIFPDLDVDVVSSPHEALEVLDLQGIRPLAWVAGSDRSTNYRRLLAGENITCQVVEVDRMAGEADGVSATEARRAAREGDLQAFAEQMPVLDPSTLADLVMKIREAANGRSSRADQGL